MSFALNAKTLHVYGSITELGQPKQEATVYIYYYGLDTTTITDQYGYYHAVVDVPSTNGEVRVATINCINDTVSNTEYFSTNQNLINSHFNLCSQNNIIAVSGRVYSFLDRAKNQPIEFSINNFKTIIESTNSNQEGDFSINLQVGNHKDGTLYARVKDCFGKYLVSQTEFNISDTSFFALSNCKHPDYSLVTGQISSPYGNIRSTDMELLLYRYDKSSHSLILHDSSLSKAGGGYDFFLSEFDSYLLKVVPSSTAVPFMPFYVDGSNFWQNEEVLSVKNAINGLINKNPSAKTRQFKTGHAIIKGNLQEQPGFELSTRNHTVLLCNEDLIPIDFCMLNDKNEYSFKQIKAGTYYVWIDDPGKICSPAKIVVSNTTIEHHAPILISNAHGISPEGVLQTQSVSSQNTINCFPNPFVNFIQFNLEMEEEALVTVRDTQGRIVLEQTVSSNAQLSTFDLPSGSYVVRLASPKFSIVKRMVKL